MTPEYFPDFTKITPKYMPKISTLMNASHRCLASDEKIVCIKKFGLELKSQAFMMNKSKQIQYR